MRFVIVVLTGIQNGKFPLLLFILFPLRINDVSAEKHKMKLMLQEKDGVISDLQRR